MAGRLISAAGAAIALCCASSLPTAAAKVNNVTVLVGFGGNTQIQQYTMDPATGAASLTNSVGASRASYMTTDDSYRFLYVTDDSYGGGIVVFNITHNSTGVGDIQLDWNMKSGTLYPGNNPVSIFYHNGAIYSVSYGGGTFNSWQALSNGTVLRTYQHIGACTKAHQIIVVPNKIAGYAGTQSTVFVPCLGVDQILVDVAEAGCGSGSSGTVCNSGEDGFSREGSGPRHLVVHPKLPLIYVINELDSSLATWQYEDIIGPQPSISRPVYISSLPPEFANVSVTQFAGAEVALHPSNKWLYASNRHLVATDPATNTTLYSTIGQFAVDSTTGALTPVAWFTGEGTVNYPRHFSLNREGTWLACANQKGGSITMFSINQQTGALTYAGVVSTADGQGGGLDPTFVMFLQPVTPTPKPGANGAASVRLGSGSADLMASTAAVVLATSLALLVARERE